MEIITYKKKGLKFIKGDTRKEAIKNIISNTLHFVLILSLMLLIVVLVKTDLGERMHLGVLNHIIESNLKKYDLSDNKEFNYIYYSKDVISSEKENIENSLSEISYLTDEMVANNLKIIITKNSVRDVVEIIGDNLIRSSHNEDDDTIGSYFPQLNLMVITLYNLDNLYSLLNVDGEIDYTIEELLYIADEFNIGTLMHEIGHFLDDISESSLHYNEDFKASYSEEKDFIFNEEENYYKSTISEYIAECLASILSDNLEDSTLNNTKTYDILYSFLDKFK